MPTYDAGDASINIRPSLKGFRGELESELKKIDASIGVSVHPNLAQARADLARWRAMEESKAVDIPIRAHYDQTGRKALNDLKRDAEDVGGKMMSALKWNAGALGVGSLPAIATALATVAGSLQQVIQAGLAVPGIMGGAVSSIGTLVVGLSGIKDAYDAVTKASESSGVDQAAQAKAATAAHQQLRNAVVDDAQAHKDLSQAYQDAKQRLVDLNIEQRGGVISEAQAINDAKKARRDLAQGRFKDALDYQDAVLRVQAADQRVVESHQRNIELQQKVSQENAKGVEQSDEVVAAKERVVRADQQVENAQQAVADASTKASAAQTAAAQAMAKLSPQGREFLQTVIALKPEFASLKNTLQDNLFAGLSAGFRNLVESDLPNLKNGMGGIATAWNANFKQLFSSLGSDSSKGLLDRILGNTQEAQQRFTKAIDPIVHAIGTLTAGSSDALPRLADAITNVANRFNNFITAADADGRLKKWIDEGLTALTNLGNTALNIASSIGAITKAAGGGDGLLGALERGTKKMSEFLNSDEGQEKLKNFFREGREQLEKWWGVLKNVPGMLQGLYDGAKAWTDVLLPPLKTITGILKDHPDLIKAVAEAFLAWKTMEFAGGILGQFSKISDALGTKGTGKKGAGGRGLLGKIGLLAATLGAMHLLDDTGIDGPDVQPTTTGDRFGNMFGDAAAGAAVGAQVAGAPGAVVGTVLGAGKGVLDSATQDINAGKRQNEKRWQQDQAAGPDRPGSPEKANDATGHNGALLPSIYNPDGTLKPTAADDLKAKILAGQLPGFSIGPDGRIIGPDGQPLPGFKAGGPTPSGRGNGPTGGFISELHSDEFVANRRGRTVLGDDFLHAANMGIVDIGRLPGFEPGGSIDPGGKVVHSGTGNFNPGVQIDTSNTRATDRLSGWLLGDLGTRAIDYNDYLGLVQDTYGPNPSQGRRMPGFEPGGFVDPNGNPIYSGAAPGPADGGASLAAGGGLPGIANSFLGALGGPLGGIFGGQQSAGASQGGGAGLAGLFAAGDDPQKQDAWMQQTGDWLGTWAGGALAKGISTLYTGVLGFFGLENSVLSPSNPWFQAATKSLGIFNQNESSYGAAEFGTEDIGNGLTAPTYGTSRGSGTPAMLAVGGLWDKVAQAESSGNWQNADTGKNGHYGGLQFSPATWAAFGGNEFAAMPNLATREQQITVANRTAFTGYNGTAPQGLGAWEVITKGMVPGVDTSTPAAAFGGAGSPRRGGGSLPTLTAGQWDVVDAIGSKFGLSVTSGFRDPNGPTVAGVAANASYHGSGRAHDYGGSPDARLAFANFMADNFGQQLKELIYDAPGFNKTIKNGQVVGPFGAFYTMAQAGDHSDHVHIAYDDGGWLMPGAALTVNKTGQPEAILNPAQSRAYQTVAAHIEKQGAAIQPVTPQLPDVRKLDPGRGATPIPSAPVTPLPAPVAAAPMPAPAPPPVSAGADQGPAPDQQKPTQPVIAGAPSSQSHLLPAVQKTITEGASTLGTLAATAASMGAGAAGGAGGAGAGTLIQGMFNLGGKAVSGAANVFASALVGNLGDNTTAGAYGAPVLSTPPQPAQPIDNRTMFGDVQVGDPRQFVEEMALYEQQRSQAQEGYVR